jgi:hypothetical protein
MMERLISKIFKQKEDEPDGGEADIEDFSWRKTILNKEVLYFSTKPALCSASEPQPFADFDRLIRLD